MAVIFNWLLFAMRFLPRVIFPPYTDIDRKVEQTCSKMIQQGKSVVLTRSFLASIYMDQRRYEEAKQQLEASLALAHQPNLIEDYVETLAYLGRYEEALNEGQKAIAQQKTGRLCYFIGFCKMKKGQYHEAIQFLLESQRLKYANKMTNLQLGFCYSQLGEYAKALAVYEIAQKYDSKSQDIKKCIGIVHMNLGASLTNQGKYEEAIAQLQEACKMISGDSRVHYNLGLTHLKAGRKEKGLEALRQAQSLGLTARAAATVQELLQIYEDLEFYKLVSKLKIEEHNPGEGVNS